MEAILYKTQKLGAKNLPRALPLLEAQYREHDIPMGGARLRKALREQIKPSNGVLLATSDFSGVAVLAWGFSLERGARIAWLEELYVVPEKRGQGIGHLLIAAAKREALRAKCVAMQLEVVRGHERAAHLYLREGFEELPRRRYSLDLRHGRRAPPVGS
jgi:GNAT superfamily N-acetyltransferase